MQQAPETRSSIPCRGKTTQKKRSRAEKNIYWIEKYLRIPEGTFVGQPVRLREWQKEIIRGIYDRPTRRAIITFGRKNAKTTLSAFLLLLHLCGYEGRERPNSQLYSAAMSRDQAALLFGLAAKMVRMSPDLNPIINIKEASKVLTCEPLGTTYRALSADAPTAMGLSPALCIHDELGQVRGSRSALYEALETATGAHENPLSVIISTQAPHDQDLLSILIDDALAGDDPRTFISMHSCPLDDDPFTEAAIRKANPAFGDFLNAQEVMSMAQAAQRMPSKEQEFRNLVLNQRVESVAPFISRTKWNENGAPIKPFDDKVPVYCGLDLSSAIDLTCLVSVAKIDGVWQVDPVFWLPADGLEEKGRQDHVEYGRWVREGHLFTTPGAAVDYDYVAAFLAKQFQQRNIKKIAFDRWNFKHLRAALIRAGFTEPKIEKYFEPFGQGFETMGPSLLALEKEFAANRIAHGNHPVLTMCAFNAVCDMSPSGFRKFTKAKATGRIDGMVALAMAMGVALDEVERPFTMFFV